MGRPQVRSPARSRHTSRVSPFAALKAHTSLIYATRQASKEHCEWRAIANADQSDDSEDPKRAYGRVRWNGSMYDLTGTFLAEAAYCLSRESKTLAHEIGGGVLTPATLGASYLSRLQKAGLETSVSILP